MPAGASPDRHNVGYIFYVQQTGEGPISDRTQEERYSEMRQYHAEDKQPL